MVTVKLSALKKRADFLRARSGTRAHKAHFVLQLVKSEDQTVTEPSVAHLRVGLTVTKKCGNAVIRNRIKRRLREATKLAFAHADFARSLSNKKPMPQNCDLVVIARDSLAHAPFDEIVQDMRTGFLRALEGKAPADSSKHR